MVKTDCGQALRQELLSLSAKWWDEQMEGSVVYAREQNRLDFNLTWFFRPR